MKYCVVIDVGVFRSPKWAVRVDTGDCLEPGQLIARFEDCDDARYTAQALTKRDEQARLDRLEVDLIKLEERKKAACST